MVGSIGSELQRFSINAQKNSQQKRRREKVPFRIHSTISLKKKTFSSICSSIICFRNPFRRKGLRTSHSAPASHPLLSFHSLEDKSFYCCSRRLAGFIFSSIADLSPGLLLLFFGSRSFIPSFLQRKRKQAAIPVLPDCACFL